MRQNNDTSNSVKRDCLAIMQQLELAPGAPEMNSLTRQVLPEAILRHSIRVFHYAKWYGDKEGSEWCTPEKLPLLFFACLGHDLGAADRFNGESRFEVEGADATTELMTAHGYEAEACHRVWCAIALHTSAGIAERIDNFTKLVRVAVKIDFSQVTREEYGAEGYAKEVETFLPRLDVEKVLGDAVVKQAREVPHHIDNNTWPDSKKHPKASWPGILLRAFAEDPHYQGINPAF